MTPPHAELQTRLRLWTKSLPIFYCHLCGRAMSPAMTIQSACSVMVCLVLCFDALIHFTTAFSWVRQHETFKERSSGTRAGLWHRPSSGAPWHALYFSLISSV